MTLVLFNKFYLLIIILFLLIDIILRIFRWWILFRSQEQKIEINVLVYPALAAFFYNFLLPGRIGDLIRLSVLKDKYDITYSVGFSVILVEQVINLMGLVIVVFLSLALILFDRISLNLRVINILLPFGFLSLIIVIIGIASLFIIDSTILIPLFSFLPEKFSTKITSLLHTFTFGTKTIKKKFYIFWLALGSSIIVWSLEAIIIWIITINIINPNFDPPVAFLASALGNLNFILPILPGAILQYDVVVSAILTLSRYSNGPLDALTIAFTDRVIKTVLLSLLGGYSILKLGDRPLKLMKRKRQEIEKIEEAKEQFLG